MSLQVEDPRSRGRSRSQSRHRDSDSKHKRDKSTGPSIVSADPRGSSSGLPYPMYPAGGSSESSYVRPPSPPGTGYYTRPNADHANMPGSYAMSGGLGPAPASYASSTASYSAHPTYTASPPSGSGYTGTSPPASYAEFDPKISSPKGVTSPGGVLDNITSFLPAKYASQFVGDEEEKERKKAKKAAKKVAKAEKLEDDLAYGSYVPHVQDVVSSVTSVDPPAEVTPSYTKPQYSRANEDVRYDGDSAPPLPPRYGNTLSPTDGRDEENRSSSRHRSNSSSSRKEYKYTYERYSEDPRSSNPSVVTIEPGKSSRRERSKSRERRRETLPPRRDDSRERRSRFRAESSPQPPSGRLSLLTVQTPHHGASLSLSSAPPSPMLEAYHGTYQAMSPMPSPIMGPSMGPDGYYPASSGGRPYSSSDDDDDDFKSPSSPRFERRARFHDAGDDARKIAEALRGKTPDIRPLVEILPGMTHDQIMELRQEYKRIVTTGPQKLGVNIAKHIRSKLKDEDSSLMKACYATALGRWESEAYWANFWYQGDKTRRELLIEALMGRTNAEIKEIRRGFSDKKYDNSLSRCMRTELKEDKFKKAVMMVLDENRMEDWDIRHGRPMKIDRDLVEEDVKELHRAVKSTKGGETTMLTIVVTRSDGHLKEVLRQYEKTYKSNFAKEALKKSGNLVGEVLAHILNGVINKPLRDAMLVNHALTLSRRDDLKRELLISRLVRYHWDREHMKAVKRCYRERYGKDMQDAVAKEVGDREWGHFCEQLCISRMPGSVKQVERVEIISDRRRD